MEPSRPDAPRWGWLDVAAAFLTALLATVVVQGAYAAIRGLDADDLAMERLTIGEIALFQVPFWLGILGLPLLATRLRGNGPVRDIGLSTTRADLTAGLAIGVVCQLVLVPLVSYPLLWLLDRDRSDLEEPARELADKATGAGVLTLVLMVVVVAPLAEEVFYRGLLQRTAERWLPSWAAMALTAVLFGASHQQGLQFPALAVFGLVLSVLAHRTGRLGRNIWAHVGFNATSVVLLLS